MAYVNGALLIIILLMLGRLMDHLNVPALF